MISLFTVADNFGVATYAIFLFFLTIWWSYNWEDASACPYTHMEDLCEGNCSVKDVALKTWAALMGGCCVFRYVQLYWWLEVTENHEGRAFEDCSADLKVDPYVGAVIEGIATLLCRIASKSIAELNPRFGTIIDSFIGTSLVVLGNVELFLFPKMKIISNLIIKQLSTTLVDTSIRYLLPPSNGAVTVTQIWNM